jgi:hypothetical protein
MIFSERSLPKMCSESPFRPGLPPSLLHHPSLSLTWPLCVARASSTSFALSARRMRMIFAARWRRMWQSEIHNSTCSVRFRGFHLMDKLKSCCGSFCGCFGNVLRTKASLYTLMFLCLFWATFNLVLSSMTINPVVTPETFITGCTTKDFCDNKCLGGRPSGPNAPIIPNPVEFIGSNRNGDQIWKIQCSWLIGPNASRFCCAISSIIMFIVVGVWVFRTPYPQYSKFFHVIPFIAADAWWWAVMVTDATEIIKSNDQCKALLPIFLSAAVPNLSVRLPIISCMTLFPHTTRRSA